VLVCGGRDYADRRLLFATLDSIHERTPISLIISGACSDPDHDGDMRGADWIGIQWAVSRQVDFAGCPARWRVDGYPQAGPKRNQRMLDDHSPDIVVAASGGSGTSDMVRRARKAGVEVVEVKSE